MNEQLSHPDVCDNKSVGVVVHNLGKVLLLERATYPYGLACPAGHIDDHGSAEQAAVNEVYEETGVKLAVNSLKLVITEQRMNRSCRRTGGAYHDWTVYTANTEQLDLYPSAGETNGADWYSFSDIFELVNKALAQGNGSVPKESTPMLLEPAWVDLLDSCRRSGALNEYDCAI